jgi:hypothetical protein
MEKLRQVQEIPASKLKDIELNLRRMRRGRVVSKDWQLFLHEQEDKEKLQQVQEIPASKLKNIELNLWRVGGRGWLQKTDSCFCMSRRTRKSCGRCRRSQPPSWRRSSSTSGGWGWAGWLRKTDSSFCMSRRTTKSCGRCRRSQPPSWRISSWTSRSWRRPRPSSSSLRARFQRVTKSAPDSGVLTFSQCCGSGLAGPRLWLMDPDPELDLDPAIFVIDLQDAKKINLKKVFLLITLKVLLRHFSKIKS